MMYLGGHSIVGCGWNGQRAVYLDFQSQYSIGWLWQLYANRTLIGRTTSPTQRRITGQLLDFDVPSPLTLVRVDPASVTANYGSQLPEMPWNRFSLQWSAESFPADTDHFSITASRAAGEDVDDANLIANVPFTGDGNYSFQLPPVQSAGSWKYSVTSKDNAKPDGNPSDVRTVTINVSVPPPDVTADESGNRFSLSITEGVLKASFQY